MKKMMMIAALMSFGTTVAVVPANAQKTTVKVADASQLCGCESAKL